MNVITLDFETYFEPKEYSLKKMTTEAYVRDPRFQALGVAIRDEHGRTVYHEGPSAVGEALRHIAWDKTICLAHHAQFDGLVLAHHYGYHPAFWLDTFSMARHSIGNHIRKGLDSLAAYYGLEPKRVPYSLFASRRYEDLDVETRRLLAEGSCHDVDLTFDIFRRLLADFPREELDVIDLTIQMFTKPLLEGARDERGKLHFAWIAEKEQLCKNEILMDLGVTDKELGSNAKFQALLEAEGVEIQWKDGKNGKIHAFAKTDDFMRELQEHANPHVVELAEARLAIKSSIDETRAGRLCAMASRGPMPVYLSYCGAQTTRWSGGDGVNYQNFSRPPRDDQPDSRKGELRRGVKAPDGCLLSVIDKSQIECRLLNMVAGQWDVIGRFRNGEDPYLPNACRFYGREITKEDKPERGFGKQLELSCGYGAGGESIVATAKRGTYGPPIELSPEQGVAARDLYRSTHPQVVKLWYEGNDVLRYLKEGSRKIWRDVCEIKGSRIYLPNGSWMNYWLRWNPDERCWQRKTRDGWRHIWGGVIVQNLMEGLARVDLSQGFIDLARAGIRVVGTVHDEGWFVHPRSEAEARHMVCMDRLRASPAWLPELPLAVEGHLGEGYEK